MIEELKKEMQSLRSPKKAETLSRFFKTGKGEYGEGDLFLGLTVPESRSIARKYAHISFGEIKELLKSKFHEERLVALLILVHNYNQGNQKQKDDVYNFYINNMLFINNWDLVDLTADKIVGAHLLDKGKDILYNIAKSKNLWERRISIVATFHFIRKHSFNETLKIAELLLDDDHDLIHKAVGWMLREVGKRNQEDEETFLKKHYKKMPRTMLRYAVERFSESKRKLYLDK